MLAFLYIIMSILLGAGIISILRPYWENRVSFIFKDRNLIHPYFLFLPSAYLIGTLLLSWFTYFMATVFRSSGNPLFFANLISFLIAIAALILYAVLRHFRCKKEWYVLKKHGPKIHLSWIEWFVILTSAGLSCFLLTRSLYMENDMLYVGYSAFSDFGAHLPVIRSFSQGQNFPALYPHFPDGTMRYHFMFYFLAGNLEYLGLSLPLALNLPSIFSLISFGMLLYALCTGITKRPVAGLLTFVFFFFRSSFAFFTYSATFEKLSEFLHAIGRNLDADGNHREHIGNTLYESWGLWSQKVYVNQRHLAFAFGIMIVILFLILPVFLETIKQINEKIKKLKSRDALRLKSFTRFIIETFLTRNAWIPEFYMPGIFAGILLGLIAFWNGAVVIATLSVLLIMSIISKHKLEYLVIAVITFILSICQSRLFIGSQKDAVSVQFNTGFLAESKSVFDILSYYVELLGFLPFVLLGWFIFILARKKIWYGFTASVLIFLFSLFFLPDIGSFWKGFFIALFFGFFLYLVFNKNRQVQTFSLWLIPVFSAPIILATTLQLTPDITVNHKYIIMAVILLNIPASDLLTVLFRTGKKIGPVIVLIIIFTMISTGLIDLFTLCNLDKNSVSYNQKDPVQVWAENQTQPEDIFLTDYMTHYGAAMSLLLAGRSVYSGYPYFTMTAGYDASLRNNIMFTIYSTDDPDLLRDLAISEGIRYIVLDEQNRIATDYTVNEEILFLTFPIAFQDTERDIFIFSVP